MELLHACSYLQLLLVYKDIWISLFAAIFKSQLYKIASTVTAVEFGTIYHYSTRISSVFEAYVLQFYTQTKN